MIPKYYEPTEQGNNLKYDQNMEVLKNAQMHTPTYHNPPHLRTTIHHFKLGLKRETQL